MEKQRVRRKKEKSSTVSESANNGSSSGAVILEDLFYGAGTGSHVHNPIGLGSKRKKGFGVWGKAKSN